MDTTVIECRNKTAKVVAPLQANGDWTTNLKESIAVYKGDQIACRNVFVDTKAQQAGPNTKIQIPTNTTLEFDYMLYNVNWEGAVATNPDNDSYPDSAVLPINALEGTYEPKNDGKLYVACEEKTIPPLTAVMRTLYEVQFKGVFFAQTGGQFTVSVLFTDDTNTTKHRTVYLPKVEWDDVQEAPALIGFNENGNPNTPTGPLGSPIGVYVALADGSPDFKIPLATYTKGGFTYNGGKFYKDTSVYPLNSKVGPALPTKQYTPKIFKTTITLEGGPNVSYDPVDLCQTINRKLTAIDPSTVSATKLNGDNLFLQHVGKDQPAGNEEFNYFIPVLDTTTTGGNKFGYQYNVNAATGSRWVGASQVELSYDPNLNKFQFDFLHTPLLDSGSLSVAMIRREQHPSTTYDTIPINKNGGILLHNLLAFDDEGKGIPFWSETLGFGKTGTTQGRGSLNYMLNNVAPSPKGSDGVDFSINGTPVSLPVFINPVKDGVNITGGFQGIDSVLQKQSSDFNIPPTLPTSSGAEVIFSTSDKQISVEAATTTFNSRSEIDFGYFLVEVQTKFTTRMLTEIQSHRNRVAIVSRYYQQDSYTSAAEDAAIVYTHNSDEPLYINSFKCRILDSDGDLATVGVDNTLFLQVVRALPLPEQLPLPPPQEKGKENEKM
jgi:hypothetical protein